MINKRNNPNTSHKIKHEQTSRTDEAKTYQCKKVVISDAGRTCNTTREKQKSQ